MAWDKNDVITAILLIILIALGSLAALYLLGIFPGMQQYIPFR